MELLKPATIGMITIGWQNKGRGNVNDIWLSADGDSASWFLACTVKSCVPGAALVWAKRAIDHSAHAPSPGIGTCSNSLRLPRESFPSTTAGMPEPESAVARRLAARGRPDSGLKECQMYPSCPASLSAVDTQVVSSCASQTSRIRFDGKPT